MNSQQTRIADEWWAGIADIRTAIAELGFIKGLADGSLDEEAFVWFLAQDALYLREFARVLGEAAKLAPTPAESEFWTHCAEDANASELELHASWLAPGEMFDAIPGSATIRYNDHLSAAAQSGSYSDLIATVLPCFWIYFDVGMRLLERSYDGHPYSAWLETYGDPAFADLNAKAVDVVTAHAAGVGEADRRRMRDAFDESARHELAFFAAVPVA